MEKPTKCGDLYVMFDGSKFQKVLYSYLATFSLFAGIAVMAFPSSVFVETIGINIQTMICHAGMVVVGVVLLASRVVDLNFKTILRALPVFALCLSLRLSQTSYSTKRAIPKISICSS